MTGGYPFSEEFKTIETQEEKKNVGKQMTFEEQYKQCQKELAPLIAEYDYLNEIGFSEYTLKEMYPAFPDKNPSETLIEYYERLKKYMKEKKEIKENYMKKLEENYRKNQNRE